VVNEEKELRKWLIQWFADENNAKHPFPHVFSERGIITLDGEWKLKKLAKDLLEFGRK